MGENRTLKKKREKQGRKIEGRPNLSFESFLSQSNYYSGNLLFSVIINK